MIGIIDGAALSLAGLTGEIVCAYVTKNSVPSAELPKLIEVVHAALKALQSGAPIAAPALEIEKPSPAQIRKSVQHDGIVSFIDGKSYKTLKRHLTTRGLDPRSYREHYGLPTDYPMVARAYAERRSQLAKALGLGRSGGQAERKDRTRKAA
ncbi:MucR family transcriptional regulator [Methylobacterium sp. NEAU K]|uniref:MucR family transcriptional regulator n=1 Tax=Methylobacterium sp. NEAU K TaxID=3064946 RepID=UPI0027340E8C|nr:MucR family transcriptional regulator [Methylobacterium sp. NEAU K]MDP4006932.1 MucR family transcriptional regulator [Methylobacterium sp. NEAU K]